MLLKVVQQFLKLPVTIEVEVEMAQPFKKRMGTEVMQSRISLAFPVCATVIVSACIINLLLKSKMACI